jgi:hypothetical protein
MRLGEPEIRSKRFRKDQIFCFAGIRTPDHPAHNMYHILIHNILPVSTIAVTYKFIQSDPLKLWLKHQYSETNVMQFLFVLLRINGLYMFRALLAHLQEALHKWLVVDCVRIISVDCYQDWSGTGVEDN